MKFILIALTMSVSLGALAQALPKKALVYGGRGACEEDCVTGAVEAARIAGFTPVIVYPNTFHSSMLKDAAVWIQPGGTAVTASKAMGSSMMKSIRAFVKDGGGYVGFCAGAFLATSQIGTSWTSGLGIALGSTKLYDADGYPTIEKMAVKLNGANVSRRIYWEGGPYFKLSSADLKKAEVIATYSRTKQVGAIQNTYYKGRVSVTGAHPEAPKWWRDSSNLIDSDGLDYDVTTAMIQWAAKKN